MAPIRSGFTDRRRRESSVRLHFLQVYIWQLQATWVCSRICRKRATKATRQNQVAAFGDKHFGTRSRSILTVCGDQLLILLVRFVTTKLSVRNRLTGAQESGQAEQRVNRSPSLFPANSVALTVRARLSLVAQQATTCFSRSQIDRTADAWHIACFLSRDRCRRHSALAARDWLAHLR